jgi:hypothetical protein
MDNGIKSSNLFDRIICVLSYFTFGFVGLVWLIWCALAKKPFRHFMLYHIYQSIFLGLLLTIISLFFNVVMSIIIAIPFVGEFLNNIIIYLNTPFLGTFSIIQWGILLILIYLSYGTMGGRYTYFPFVSDIISANFRR